MIGKRIKKLRKENDMTQRQLAEKLGVTRGAIGHYEREKRLPDYEIISKIADLFDTTTDYLIGRTKNKDNYLKIKQALEGNEKLISFWDEMQDRPDLQLLFKQTQNLSDESIQAVVQFMKSVEKDHKNSR